MPRSPVASVARMMLLLLAAALAISGASWLGIGTILAPFWTRSTGAVALLLCGVLLLLRGLSRLIPLACMFVARALEER